MSLMRRTLALRRRILKPPKSRSDQRTGPAMRRIDAALPGSPLSLQQFEQARAHSRLAHLVVRDRSAFRLLRRRRQVAAIRGQPDDLGWRLLNAGIIDHALHLCASVVSLPGLE
jgi:hypothetical protein